MEEQIVEMLSKLYYKTEKTEQLNQQLSAARDDVQIRFDRVSYSYYAEEEEEDPRTELVQKLLEYKLYKYMSYELKDRQIDAGRALFREPSIPKEIMDYREPVNYEELVGDMTLQKLNEIFQSMVKRQEDRVDPIRSKFGNVEKDEIPLEDKQNYIFRYLTANKRCSFKQLLEKQHSKMEIIVTFLVVLELMKVGQITISQDNLFDDIIIERNNDNEEVSLGADFAIV